MWFFLLVAKIRLLHSQQSRAITSCWYCVRMDDRAERKINSSALPTYQNNFVTRLTIEIPLPSGGDCHCIKILHAVFSFTPAMSLWPQRRQVTCISNTHMKTVRCHALPNADEHAWWQKQHQATASQWNQMACRCLLAPAPNSSASFAGSSSTSMTARAWGTKRIHGFRMCVVVWRTQPNPTTTSEISRGFWLNHLNESCAQANIFPLFNRIDLVSAHKTFFNPSKFSCHVTQSYSTIT